MTYPAEDWTHAECAFCNDRMDYCQGHGDNGYAVRVQADGELVRPLDFYSTEDEAYAAMGGLLSVLGSGMHVDVFDKAGDVLASEYVS